MSTLAETQEARLNEVATAYVNDMIWNTARCRSIVILQRFVYTSESMVAAFQNFMNNVEIQISANEFLFYAYLNESDNLASFEVRDKGESFYWLIPFIKELSLRNVNKWIIRYLKKVNEEEVINELSIYCRNIPFPSEFPWKLFNKLTNAKMNTNWLCAIRLNEMPCFHTLAINFESIDHLEKTFKISSINAKVLRLEVFSDTILPFVEKVKNVRKQLTRTEVVCIDFYSRSFKLMSQKKEPNYEEINPSEIITALKKIMPNLQIVEIFYEFPKLFVNAKELLTKSDILIAHNVSKLQTALETVTGIQDMTIRMKCAMGIELDDSPELDELKEHDYYPKHEVCIAPNKTVDVQIILT